jgi:AAA+ ATPase superfamily predicted ATPase
MNQHSQPKFAIRPIVPETVYTNRNEHLNYLYQAALNAIERRSMSVVLLGRRRMGKTEIVKRVVNRLFFAHRSISFDIFSLDMSNHLKTKDNFNFSDF